MNHNSTSIDVASDDRHKASSIEHRSRRTCTCMIVPSFLVVHIRSRWGYEDLYPSIMISLAKLIRTRAAAAATDLPPASVRAQWRSCRLPVACRTDGLWPTGPAHIGEIDNDALSGPCPSGHPDPYNKNNPTLLHRQQRHSFTA